MSGKPSVGRGSLELGVMVGAALVSFYVVLNNQEYRHLREAHLPANLMVQQVPEKRSYLGNIKKVTRLVDRYYTYSLLISVAGMAVYTGYVFMPQHIMAILHYFEVIQG